MKKHVAGFLIFWILSAALFCEPELLYLPREPDPFSLFSPSGSYEIVSSEDKWPSKLRITTDGDGRNVQIVAVELPSFSLERRTINLWIRVENLGALRELWVYTASDSAFADRLVFMPSDDRSQLLDNQWLKISLPFSSGKRWGNPDVTDLKAFQFWVNDDGSGPVSVEVGPVYLDAASSEGAAVMTFDDGWATDITTAAPVMQKYGLRGTSYVIPEKIGTPGYMSAAQLAELKSSYGWSLGTHYSSPLDNSPEDKLREHFADQLSWFSDIGINPADFSYPNGAYNTLLLSVLPDYFQSARTIVEFPESLPPGDPYRLRSLNIVPGLSADLIRRRITDAAANGELAVLIFHRIVENSSYETELEVGAFEEICRMIADSGIKTFSMEELSARWSQVKLPEIDWAAATIFQPVQEPENPAPDADEKVIGINPIIAAAGSPEQRSDIQFDISLDWKLVLGKRVSDSPVPSTSVNSGVKGDFQYYNQLEDLYIYLQSSLSESARLFASAGIGEVNFADLTPGAIDGSLFELSSLYLSQSFNDAVTLEAGYFSPDPVNKWLQVTRSSTVEPAFGQDITPVSLWINTRFTPFEGVGLQLGFNPDFIGKTIDAERVLTYQQELGVPNLFASIWYNDSFLTFETAAALNGDAVKLVSAAAVNIGFENYSLLGSLGFKYITGDSFKTFPDWDHINGIRLSTGWSFSIPAGTVFLSAGPAYQIIFPAAGGIRHMAGVDAGIAYKNMELFSVFTCYDLANFQWQNNAGFEAGFIIEFDGVDYLLGYTMSGFNSLSGLYNNKDFLEGGVNGLFVRIKATYW